MSTPPAEQTPPAPHRWTFSGWRHRNPRLAARLRLVLAVGGVVLIGVIGAAFTAGTIPTVTSGDCVFAAEQAHAPAEGLTVPAGQSFSIDWQFYQSGSCQSWDGVRLSRRNAQVPSGDESYVVGNASLEALDGQAPRLVLRATTVMTAPAAAGIYETAWQLYTAGGRFFGPVVTRRVQVFTIDMQLPPPIPNQTRETVIGLVLGWVLAIIKYALPVIITMVFVIWRAGGFLTELYGLKAPASGTRHVLALLFGMSTPVIRARRNQIECDPVYAAAERIGGPAWLIVAENTAVVLERGGGFSRIVGPGITLLHPHERARSAVDLNTQERHIHEKTLTKDGLPIEVDVDLVYRITARQLEGDSTVTPPPPPLGPITRLKRRLGWPIPAAFLETSKPHKFSREAVRRAVYETAVVSPDQPPDWSQRFAGMRAGDISDQIAERRLDELSAPEDPDRHPLQELVKSALEAARKAGSGQGIDVIDITMGVIEPSKDLKDAVTGQLIANWQIEWARRAKLLEAEGNARAMQLLEEARAEAQANMIQALTEGYRIAVGDSDNPAISHEVIALRFIDTLEALMQNAQLKPPKDDAPNLGLMVS